MVTSELTEDLRAMIEGELNSPLLSAKQFILSILDCTYESTQELYNELKNSIVYKNELRLAFIIAHYFYGFSKDMYFVKEMVQLFSLDTSIVKDDTCLLNFKEVVNALSCSCTAEGDLIAMMLFECIEGSILEKDVEHIAKYTYNVFAKSDWAKKEYIQKNLDRFSCYLVKSDFKKQIRSLKKIISTVGSEIPSEEVSNIYYCIGILYLMRLRKIKSSPKGKKSCDRKKRKLKIKKYNDKMLEAFLKAFKSGSQVAGKQIMNLHNRGKIKLSKAQTKDIEKIMNWQQRYIN